MRSGVVEEEAADMQEVRGSNPCKDGSKRWKMVHFCKFTAYSNVNFHNFNAFTAFHRKIVYEICGEQTNFSPLILHISAIFFDPGNIF